MLLVAWTRKTLFICIPHVNRVAVVFFSCFRLLSSTILGAISKMHENCIRRVFVLFSAFSQMHQSNWEVTSEMKRLNWWMKEKKRFKFSSLLSSMSTRCRRCCSIIFFFLKKYFVFNFNRFSEVEWEDEKNVSFFPFRSFKLCTYQADICVHIVFESTIYVLTVVSLVDSKIFNPMRLHEDESINSFTK